MKRRLRAPGRGTRNPVILLLVALLALSAAPGAVKAQEPPVTAAAAPALTPLTGIRAVTTGGVHTCALTTTGGVKCWGQDIFGQVGDGSGNTEKPIPTDVTGLTSGVQAIAAGGDHTCAITATGSVKCWGSDVEGQIGDGPADTANKPAPVDVAGLSSGVQAIAAGNDHTCAITAGGGVKCWGDDGSGQIGDGPADNANKPSPVDVVGLTSGVQAIAAGGFHTCALTAAGGVKCWGSDNAGQVGDGPANNTSKFSPVDVVDLTSGVQAIGTGFSYTCALNAAGGVKCWGSDQDGQVGDGPADNTNKFVPVNVLGLNTGIQAIAPGNLHACALTTAGSVKCWGNDGDGQAGDGSNHDDKPSPVDVDLLTGGGVAAIAAGDYHTCAVTTIGGVKCWGRDSEGQVGDGPYPLNKFVPVDVVTSQTCFKLSRAATGSGALPVAAVPFSDGCPLDHYLAATQVILQAAPAPDQRVQSWSAPVAGGPGDEVGVLTMPSADTTVTVAYAACRTLTRTHSGAGGDPSASPPNSDGCAAGKYAPGESIVLSAVPNAGQRVKTWSGATAAPATGSQVNSLAMPDADKSVNVEYEACFALVTRVSGSGDPLTVAPALSAGCLTGGFVAGETVTLLASPAAGWRIAAWSGTADDSSTAPTNTLVMPGGPTNVGVTYTPAQPRLFLPHVEQ